MVLKYLCTLQHWVLRVILTNVGFQQKPDLFLFGSEVLAFLKEMKSLFDKPPNPGADYKLWL